MMKCSVEDCPEPARAMGWCTSHYQKQRRHGHPTDYVIFCQRQDCSAPAVGAGNLCEVHRRQLDLRRATQSVPWWSHGARPVSEFDVALELATGLMERGYTVRPEFFVKVPGGPSMRADLAVWLDPNERPFLVEVKMDPERTWGGQFPNAPQRQNREQRTKYEATGLPFFYCFGMEGIPSTLRVIAIHFDQGAAA